MAHPLFCDSPALCSMSASRRAR